MQVLYDAEQSIAENRSTVNITGVKVKSLWDTVAVPCWVTGEIRINGSKAAELRLTNTHSCGIVLTKAYFEGGTQNWSGFAAYPVTVDHNPDGKMENAELQVNITVFLTNGTRLDPGISAVTVLPLPRIPRVTGLHAEQVALGQEMEIRLTREAENFTDTVTWRCGRQSGTLAEHTRAPLLHWVPPVSLAAEEIHSDCVPVELTVTTCQGETEIGTEHFSVLCRIPEEVRPAMEVTLTDDAQIFNQLGAYLQDISRLRVRTDARGVYGSRIEKITVRCGALTAQSENAVFSLPQSGTIAVTVTAGDSRGREITVNREIAVTAYHRPYIRILQSYRCTESGEEQHDGNYVKLIFEADAEPVSGSRAEYRALLQLPDGTAAGEFALAQYTGQFRLERAEAVIPAPGENAGSCVLILEDRFSQGRSAAEAIPPALLLLDFSREDAAIGIGMPAGESRTLSIGLDMNCAGHRLTNLAAPDRPEDAATKACVDAMLAPKIIEQPRDITVAAGEAAVFTVSVIALTPEYRWQVCYPRQTNWRPCGAAGFDTPRYSFTANTSHTGRSYRCMITDALGNTAYSEVAGLTVTEANGVSP